MWWRVLLLVRLGLLRLGGWLHRLAAAEVAALGLLQWAGCCWDCCGWLRLVGWLLLVLWGRLCVVAGYGRWRWYGMLGLAGGRCLDWCVVAVAWDWAVCGLSRWCRKGWWWRLTVSGSAGSRVELGRWRGSGRVAK